jgi:transcriptional regulator with XRE-family HTH domain
MEMNGMQQKDLAKASGLSTQNISNWIVKNCYPSEPHLECLAQTFGITTEELTLDHSVAADYSREYRSIAQNKLLQYYAEDILFRRYVDAGLDAKARGEISKLLEAIKGL